MLKILSLHIVLFSCFAALAQFSEDFSDGEYTSNPIWSGDTDKFVIVDNRLRSNHAPPSTESYYLSTVSSISYDATWEFYIELDLSTSGLNYVDIFLVADRLDLVNAQDGYFIRVGDTADEIILYKLSNGEKYVLIDDNVRRVDGSTNNIFKIWVSRGASDLFTMEVDDGNTGSFATVGTATDSEITVSSAFGVLIKQSKAASAVNSHFFDDFQLIGTSYPDTMAPALSSYELLSDRQVMLSFSEEVDKLSAESTTNYTFSPVLGVKHVDKQVSQTHQVILNLDEPMVNGTVYMLSLKNIEDLSGNAIPPTELSIEYIIFSVPSAGDILINEFQVAPNDSEFVELYNYSDKYFNLENWKIEDEVGNQLLLPDYRLDPQQYVVITSFFGIDSLAVSGFPMFNNSSDAVILNYIDGTTVHEISYDDFEEGKSLELINPQDICKGFVNYAINPNGNSAGRENHNFSLVVDKEGPSLVGLQVQAADSITVVFDEPIGEVHSLADSFLVNDQLVEQAVLVGDGSKIDLVLDVPLIDEVLGNLSIKNLPDCLGNLSGNIDTTLYFDSKAPEVTSIVLLSATELIINFQEELEAITASDLAKFSLSERVIQKVDETDTTNASVLIDLLLPLEKANQYELIISGLEDTLGNASIDTVLFTFESVVNGFEILSSNTLAIQFAVGIDTNRTSTKNFWIEGLGTAHNVDFIQGNLVQVSFDEPFEENELFKLYCQNLIDVFSQPLSTPALEVIFDTEPPLLDVWQIPHQDSIFLIFNEPLDLSSAVNFSHYKINERVPQHLLLLSDSSLYLRPPFSLDAEVFYDLELLELEDLVGNKIIKKQRYEIMFDTKAPRVEYLSQVSMNQFQVSANEPLDTSQAITSGWISDTGSQAGAVSFIGRDRLLISMIDSIPQRDQLTFYLSQWADMSGNTTLDTIKVEISTKRPAVVQVTPVSQTLVSIEYNQRMSTSVLDIDNYQLDGQTIESVSELDGRYLLHVAPGLSAKDSTYLDIAHVANTSGNSMIDTTVFFQYDNFLKEIRVLDTSQIVIDFVEELDVNSSFNVSIEDLSVRYQGVDLYNTNAYEITFNTPLPENREVSIRWDSAKTELGRVIPGYESLFTYDTQVPTIERVESGFFNQVSIYFSEPMEASVCLETFNYRILNLGAPLKVSQFSDAGFLLTFDSLVLERSYTLIAKNLEDQSSNLNPSDTVNFVYVPPALPGFQELRITEIMPDPSPVVGLPDIEYLEIWNGSDKTYTLEGVFIRDESGDYALPDTLIAPNTYMALAGEKESLFVYVSDFPSLYNSGESIALLSVSGDLIDSVTYSSQWVSNAEKRNGGYSLELVNLESSCEGPANWESSFSTLGGTPGSINSIASDYPDTIAPNIETFALVDSFRISLSFSEYMDTSFLPVLTNTEWQVQYKDLQNATILMNTALTSGFIHAMPVGGFLDCSGNALQDTLLYLTVPREPQFGDLMISEIMPDPTPQVGLGEGEYVELINLTDDVLDLTDLQLNDVALNGVLMPQSYLTLVPSNLSTFDSYVNKQVVTPWIGLKNQKDTIRLTSQHEVLVELSYEDTWYNSEEKNSGGYSLEVIDPYLICGRGENWAASKAPSGGTPGEVNSIYQLIGDDVPPEIVDISYDQEVLVLTTSESLLPTGMTWDFQPPILASIREPLINFPEVLMIEFEEELVRNETYFLTLSQLSDCYGNTTENVEGKFLIPEITMEDIYVNEVLFDPKVGGDDFVELFNASDHQYLDLTALRWRTKQGSIQLTEGFVLNPRSYIVLTENRTQLLFDFPQADPSRILEVENLPALPNDEGNLTLIDFTDKVLDSIYYRSSFHSTLLSDVEGVSLERLTIELPADDNNNWSSASSIHGFATPGGENSQSILLPKNLDKLAVKPRTFVPGSSNPTYSPLTTIAIKNETNDRLANVWIVNSAGRIVKTLAQGVLLGSDSFLTWEGSSDAGNLVEMGQYLVVIELYGGDSQAEVIKKPVTVGSDF